jgi:hypothetical protein
LEEGLLGCQVPPPECVSTFSYYGVQYTGCTDIGEYGEGTFDYCWCATAVDSSGAFVVGSGSYKGCGALVTTTTTTPVPAPLVTTTTTTPVPAPPAPVPMPAATAVVCPLCACDAPSPEPAPVAAPVPMKEDSGSFKIRSMKCPDGTVIKKQVSTDGGKTWGAWEEVGTGQCPATTTTEGPYDEWGGSSAR